MTILAKGGRKYKRRKRKGAEIRGRQKLKGLSNLYLRLAQSLVASEEALN